MILNDKEKEQFVQYLKKQYTENSQLIERNEFPFWAQNDKQREDFINYTKKLKDDYEAIEKGDKFEISLSSLNFGGDNAWWGIIGLAIIAAAVGGFNGGNPENNNLS